MTEWRYIVRDAITHVVLDRDFPLSTEGPEYALSKAGSMSATVSPDVGLQRVGDASSRLILEEWGSEIYAEVDGEIRWGGLLTSADFNGADWNLEIMNMSTYPHGMPFMTKFYGVKIDPVAAVRAMWDHLQGFQNGNLGMVVSGSTPVRIGSDSDTKAANAVDAANAAKADYEAAKKALDADRDKTTAARKVFSTRSKARTAANAELTSRRKVLAKAKKDKRPAAEIAAALAAVNAQIAVVADRTAEVDAQRAVVKSLAAADAGTETQTKAVKAAYDKTVETRKVTAEAARADGGSYKLVWWEAPDIGQEIDDLATETPFDWVERHYWVPTDSRVDAETLPPGLVRWMLEVGKWTSNPTDSGEYLYRPDTATDDDIAHVIEIGYPRLGKRRDDLTFVQGENVMTTVAPKYDGDDFANEIFGLGAGEGGGSLRSTTATIDGRLRRVAVHTAKGVKTKARLDSQIRDQLLRHRLEAEIDSITVIDHPHAPIGSWDVGDDITVTAELPWLGEVSIRHRITSWAPQGTSGAVINLARSDSFTYGG